MSDFDEAACRARVKKAAGPMSNANETPDWQVGVVAQTVTGEVVLRMTTKQADELRDSLIWLTGDDQ